MVPANQLEEVSVAAGEVKKPARLVAEGAGELVV